MKKLFLILGIIILASCSNPTAVKEEKFAALKEKAMQDHDAIMPKMDEIKTLRQQLNERVTTSDMTDAATSGQLSSMLETSKKLGAAHDGMMEWMHTYSEAFPYGSELSKEEPAISKDLELMKEKQEEITQLKEETLQLITDAKTLLK